MGVTLSTNTLYAPFAFATGIIGLVSFAFTVGTFLKVVWINIETMSASAHSVHSFLTNLRAELLEERASVRHMRREARAYRRKQHRRSHASEHGEPSVALDDVSLKLIADYLKILIRRFHDVEVKFLAPGAEGIEGYKAHEEKERDHRRRRGDTRDRSQSPYYQHAAYSSPPEKPRSSTRRARSRPPRSRNRGEGGGGGSHSSDDEADPFWAQHTQYAPFTLSRRFVWLVRKAELQGIYESLTRTQTRRIARQVAGMSLQMHEQMHEGRSGWGRVEERLGERLARIEERMGRIVGVRRVD